MQMLVHYGLTMLTVVILVSDRRAFERQAQRIVEVGSEFILHLSSILLAQFMDGSQS